MTQRPKEFDWRHYASHVDAWRDRYLKDKTLEIAHLLANEDVAPTERFWQARARIDEEARILVQCLDHHARSKMKEIVVLMYRHGLISDADLEGFSDEFRGEVLLWVS